MKTVFDLPKIQSLIKNFYNLTDIVVTFCDSDFSYRTSSDVLSEFCSLISKTQNFRCEYCDTCALLEAKKKNDIYSYVCHAGLLESIMPVFDNDIIIAYIIIGQYRDADNRDSSLENMRKCTEGYEIDADALEEAYQRLPQLSNKQIQSMFEIFRSLIKLMWRENMIKNAADSLFSKISSYIDTNLENKIHVDALCHHFYISKNSLYKLVSQNTGMTVNDFILSKRLNRAKQLLNTTDFSITKIAEACGFSNQNYFIRAFKKHLGISPLQYRKKTHYEQKP